MGFLLLIFSNSQNDFKLVCEKSIKKNSKAHKQLNILCLVHNRKWSKNSKIFTISAKYE